MYMLAVIVQILTKNWSEALHIGVRELNSLTHFCFLYLVSTF